MNFTVETHAFLMAVIALRVYQGDPLLMKKLLPVLIVVLVGAALIFAISSKQGSDTGSGNSASDKTTTARAGSDSGGESPTSGTGDHGGISRSPLNSHQGNNTEESDDDVMDREEKPATDIYKTADEALKAIRDGAADYDDLVLDQFTQLGDNCTWCDSLYKSVRALVTSPDVKPDERSYYSEVLAVSGRVDNVKFLVDGIKNSKNEDEADTYAEALELTVGKNDVVKYLGDQLNDSNDSLREASVAAITNQGSRLAVELLYENTLKKGDPDGYYSLGIGLGEVVPDQEAMPYLLEVASKRDQYSHLAVKSLLNAGLDGVKAVVDMLSSGKNPDADKDLLKGAADHVSFEDDVVSYLKQISGTSTNPVVTNFAKEVLADFAEADGNQDSEEQLSTPLTRP